MKSKQAASNLTRIQEVQFITGPWPIPAPAGPCTPALALHSRHSYDYAFRSRAAPSRPCPAPASGILVQYTGYGCAYFCDSYASVPRHSYCNVQRAAKRLAARLASQRMVIPFATGVTQRMAALRLARREHPFDASAVLRTLTRESPLPAVRALLCHQRDALNVTI